MSFQKKCHQLALGNLNSLVLFLAIGYINQHQHLLFANDKCNHFPPRGIGWSLNTMDQELPKLTFLLSWVYGQITAMSPAPMYSLCEASWNSWSHSHDLGCRGSS